MSVILPAGYRLLSEFIRSSAAKHFHAQWLASYAAEEAAEDRLLAAAREESARCHAEADAAEAEGGAIRDRLLRQTRTVVLAMLRDGRLSVHLLLPGGAIVNIPAVFWLTPQSAESLAAEHDILAFTSRPMLRLLGRRQRVEGLLLVPDATMNVARLAFNDPQAPAGADAPAPSAPESQLPYQELQARVAASLDLRHGKHVAKKVVEAELRKVWSEEMAMDSADLSDKMVGVLATALRTLGEQRGGLRQRPT